MLKILFVLICMLLCAPEMGAAKEAQKSSSKVGQEGKKKAVKKGGKKIAKKGSTKGKKSKKSAAKKVKAGSVAEALPVPEKVSEDPHLVELKKKHESDTALIKKNYEDTVEMATSGKQAELDTLELNYSTQMQACETSKEKYIHDKAVIKEEIEKSSRAAKLSYEKELHFMEQNYNDEVALYRSKNSRGEKKQKLKEKYGK